MPIANSNFRVRNGLAVSGNTDIGGNTVIVGDLSTNGVFTANGSGHVVKGNTQFAANTLHINSVNKRAVVNAGSTSVAADTTDWAFEVNGKFKTSNSVYLANTVQVDGKLSVGNGTNKSDLYVSNSANVGVNLSVAGNVSATGNNFQFGNSSVTTPYTVIYGNLKVTGKYISDSDVQYDLDTLSSNISAIPLLKVYDVNGTQVFP